MLAKKAPRWARVHTGGPHRLRRGGWYRVLDASDPDQVVVNVGGTPRRVMRGSVTLADDRPPVWSVVRQQASTSSAPAARQMGELYGVCPNCLYRAPLTDKDLELRCRQCNQLFAVDWSQA
ncbi:MAG: hypothetical protein PVF27_02690 [Gemmatimonadales bacterium]